MHLYYKVVNVCESKLNITTGLTNVVHIWIKLDVEAHLKRAIIFTIT